MNTSRSSACAAAQFPEDKWDAIIAVCLSSAFHATKAALPGMLERKWGRIINTGSMHALVASPYKSAYNAAKHGIAGARAPLAPHCLGAAQLATIRLFRGLLLLLHRAGHKQCWS